MINPSPLLEIKRLTTQLGGGNFPFTAIDNIGFTINKGEIVGIAGESGAGKTTLALSVLKLINPPDKITKGSIVYYKDSEPIDLLLLNEKEICNYRGKEIAMIFQDPGSSLNPVYTCGHQVAETIILHEQCSNKIAKEKTINLFKEVNLADAERIFSAYPHQLSGGQLQRVMIAMSICHNPTLLIADEPTSSLDTENEKIVLGILKKLNVKKGISILLITHSLTIISELADKVVIMNKGMIEEVGDKKKLQSNPNSAYTKLLLGNTFSSVQKKVYNQSLHSGIPLLEVKSFKKYFSIQKGFFSADKENIKAVDGVSFEIYAGETVGLIGKSGCGKTTLARSILKLIDSMAGSIFFKGKDISRFSQREMQPLRKSMQIIFQNSYMALNPKINIGEAIMEAMRVHKLYNTERERNEKAIALLEKVKLDSSCFKRYPHEFSGGERQRICIARALALNPELIICDEPVSSLDTTNQLLVLDLLLQLQKEFNLAYLFISHNVSVINYMSNRVLEMESGKINAPQT